jgi:hypothetical protein
MKTPFDYFLTHDFAKESRIRTRQAQISYLKEHEEKLTTAIKAQYPKVTSVQYDWSTIDVGIVGNGTPQGGGTVLTLSGKFNGIKDSSFILSFDLKDKYALPDGSYYLQQPLRILKNGGWDIYE